MSRREDESGDTIRGTRAADEDSAAASRTCVRDLARGALAADGLRRSRPAELRLGSRDGADAAVTLVQRFASALDLNVPFHMLHLDGAIRFTEKGAQFERMAPPSPVQLDKLASGDEHPYLPRSVSAHLLALSPVSVPPGLPPPSWNPYFGPAAQTPQRPPYPLYTAHSRTGRYFVTSTKMAFVPPILYTLDSGLEKILDVEITWLDENTSRRSVESTH